jgi:competence protein ComEC
LPAALLFSAGALAMLALPAVPALPWLAGLCLPALLPWRWRGAYAVLLLGALLTAWRTQGMIDSRWPLADSDHELVVDGRIASLPETRPSGKVKQDSAEEDQEQPQPARLKHDWRFLFSPESHAGDPVLPRLIRVSWYRAEPELQGGDCWRFRLRLRAPHGLLNPGSDDYEAWLFDQGIGATATVREASPCEDHSGYWLLRARQQVVNRLEQWLPGNPALGLAAGLAVGDRSLLR